jgi:uncharacterized MAPEG superfamily protein
MSIAYWCILIAGLMPVLTVGIAKFGKGSRGYDNNNPRDWLATRVGRAKRAHAAHLNSFEAFPLFAAGVLVASAMSAPAHLINALAVAFVVLRVVYTWCYLQDHANLRSLVWVLALVCNIALFFVAAFAR